MKVVLVCGGLGMRMGDGVEPMPKPMMPIGSRPVLWHVIRYYAHFGHTEFILCLGYGGRAVRDYFLDYHEAHSTDCVLTRGGRDLELVSSDTSDWRITFGDTGVDTPIGERLRRERLFLEDDSCFLANYGDVLTDAPLNEIIDGFLATDDVATVKPQDSFHVLSMTADDRVIGTHPVAGMATRINGGYFVPRQEIFDFFDEDEELVMDACVRAAAAVRLRATPYHGFWAPMVTLRERAELEELHRFGCSPWALWRTSPPQVPRPWTTVERPEVADPSMSR